ncbi:MAG: hypothetical protein IPH01_04435 [Elusimicrobia bacterium]|nr:hypothetical protein [Elusimicrobiota bacterium]
MATINDFRKWCKNNSGMIHDGFSLHEAPAPLWQRWLPKDKNRAAAIKKQLEVFGKAPDGSWYAFWKKNEQEKPVVFLSPEGEGGRVGRHVGGVLEAVGVAVRLFREAEFE